MNFRDKVYLCEGNLITATLATPNGSRVFTEKARFAVALGVDDRGIVYDETSGPPLTAPNLSGWMYAAVGFLLGASV